MGKVTIKVTKTEVRLYINNLIIAKNLNTLQRENLTHFTKSFNSIQIIKSTSTQDTQLQEFKSSQAKAEVSSSQDDNKSNDGEEKKDDEKISFYLKLGKYKKFKYM